MSQRKYPGLCSVRVLLCTVSHRLQSHVPAHYARIQLKPRIYSMGGFKDMQLGRNSLVLNTSPETAHYFYGNGLAIWHSLSDIRHIKVNYGRSSAIYVVSNFINAKRHIYSHYGMCVFNMKEISHVFHRFASETKCRQTGERTSEATP